MDDRRYQLRPEIFESLFYLYRVTHDEKYRVHAWKMFQAIVRHCRTPAAYTSMADVTAVPPMPHNSMPSFFFAETLKYLFLIFSDDDVIPLSEWVFNTEAHPLRVFAPRVLS